MIDQLLDLAMLRSGRLALHPKEADLLSVCAALTDELDPQGAVSGQRRVHVRSRGDTRGSFDVDRISEVISNLLGNALQHGEPLTPVTLDIDGSDPGALRVQVHNAGAMERRVQPASDASEPAGGERRLGLGLQIAEQFVQAHGGSLASRSSAIEGTTFELRLRRVTAAGTISPDQDLPTLERPPLG
jgi:two-component system, sensor histidine kinase and response regulator